MSADYDRGSHLNNYTDYTILTTAAWGFTVKILDEVKGWKGEDHVHRVCQPGSDCIYNQQGTVSKYFKNHQAWNDSPNTRGFTNKNCAISGSPKGDLGGIVYQVATQVSY